MEKHLLPQNDVLPHTPCKECHCNPVLSTAVVSQEEVFFYRHISFDCMDECERAGIKTNEVWEMKIEL